MSKREFQPGHTYIVKIKGGIAVRRIFKWEETRLGSIPCYVFSSKVRKDVTATYNAEEKSITMRGKRLPATEISIPAYDIVSAKEANP